MPRFLVIVESPAKAKTLSSYLGSQYVVMATYGHIVNLPSRADAIDIANNFAPSYEPVSRTQSAMGKIKELAGSVEALYLATDPDREGEAISWHVVQQLNTTCEVHRIVFHEISKSAVMQAIQSPRALDRDLVDAQTARRLLDHMLGIYLSRALWRKLPRSQSAGRVQSAVLRMTCVREDAILNFRPSKFWRIAVDYTAVIDDKVSTLKATLCSAYAQDIKNGCVNDEDLANKITNFLKANPNATYACKVTNRTRNPSPPFCTSSLQQVAASSLGMLPQATMYAAQSLYEGVIVDGTSRALITYMRTDSTKLSDSHVHAIEQYIVANFGEKWLVKSRRTFRTKVRNAQEAHEAIRPIDVSLTPEKLRGHLQEDQWKLYSLIWNRTVATQMSSAVYKHYQVTIQHGECVLRTSGLEMVFAGFTRLHSHGDEDGDDSDVELLKLLSSKCHNLVVSDVTCEERMTTPPSRFTVGGIIKAMEETGIGRPSTYSTITSVLEKRGYIRIHGHKIIVTPRGYIVNSFLVRFFESYTDTTFTAALEEELDDIARGERSKDSVLWKFWGSFSVAIDEIEKQRQGHVLDVVRQDIECYIWQLYHMFTPASTDSDGNNTACQSPLCDSCARNLQIKFSKFGAFLGCAGYPECKKIMPLDRIFSGVFDASSAPDIMAEVETVQDGVRSLYVVSVKRGRYGHYVEQREERSSNSSAAATPRRIPVSARIAKLLTSEHLKVIPMTPLSLNQCIVGHQCALHFTKFGFAVGCGPIISFLGSNRWPTSVEGVHKIDVEDAIKMNGTFKLVRADGSSTSVKFVKGGVYVLEGRKRVAVRCDTDSVIRAIVEGGDVAELLALK